jgi:hypothetical protein
MIAVMTLNRKISFSIITGIFQAFICLILLSAALVTASTKGWLFGLKNNGEQIAMSRIQVTTKNPKLNFPPKLIAIIEPTRTFKAIPQIFNIEFPESKLSSNIL